jgi:hypothetical protein
LDKFTELLKSIISNLPLILTDTTDPINVSWNRTTMTIEFILIILVSPPLLGVTLVFYPQYFDKLYDIWKLMLTAYGVHMTVNVFKKG